MPKINEIIWFVDNTGTEVSVECQACGQILDVTVKRGNEIHVEPCSGCMDDAYNKGFDKGKEAIQ
jgi:hypothetical protein